MNTFFNTIAVLQLIFTYFGFLITTVHNERDNCPLEIGIIDQLSYDSSKITTKLINCDYNYLI